MSNSAAERQSANPGGGNNSARHRESECVSRMIDIAPGAPAANRNGASGRIDPRIFNRREIVHYPVITNPKTAAIVPAASNCEKQFVFSCEIHRRNYVRYVRATRDQ